MGRSKLTTATGEPEPFTRIPNRLIRSEKYDVYDKAVFMCIASCQPSFPSYDSLQKWTGISRERLAKSIKKLSEGGVIKIEKVGRSNLYRTHWCQNEPVRQTNYNSSPDELKPVRQANSKKNKEKEQKKTNETHVSTGQAERSFSELMAQALEHAKT